MDGGAGGNTASWLAFLERKVDLISAVGRDHNGIRLMANLRRSGVGVGSVELSDTSPTGIALAMSVGAAKYIVTMTGPSRRSAISSFPRHRFTSSCHLHLIGEPTSEVQRLAEDARGHGASVSIEANGYDPGPLLEYADLCFMNSDELRRIARPHGRSDVRRARGLVGDHGCWIVVTRGPKGATAVSRHDAVHVATTPVEPVDRTGAGDAFDAGFLDAWTKDRDVETAMVAGLRLAAKVLGQLGARPRLDGHDTE